MNQSELDALINYWSEREEHHPDEGARRYASGNAAALKLVWKVLYGLELTLREWTEMEGPDGVSWPNKEKKR